MIALQVLFLKVYDIYIFLILKIVVFIVCLISIVVILRFSINLKFQAKNSESILLRKLREVTE